jgi:hypothetical protein
MQAYRQVVTRVLRSNGNKYHPPKRGRYLFSFPIKSGWCLPVVIQAGRNRHIGVRRTIAHATSVESETQFHARRIAPSAASRLPINAKASYLTVTDCVRVVAAEQGFSPP